MTYEEEITEFLARANQISMPIVEAHLKARAPVHNGVNHREGSLRYVLEYFSPDGEIFVGTEIVYSSGSKVYEQPFGSTITGNRGRLALCYRIWISRN